MSNYNLRGIKLGLVPKPEKAKKPIAPRSEKRIKEQKEYVKIVKAAAKVDDRCKIKSPVCVGKMDGFNHKQKRSPANFLKVDNLENSCSPCNGYCEAHPEWAKNNGHSISRFKK